MEQFAPDEISAATVRRINREAGYVVLSTSVVFLTGLSGAILTGKFFGDLSGHIFLMLVFPFGIIPTAYAVVSDDYMSFVVSYATYVAVFSPLICLGIIMGWRSTVRNGRPRSFWLALRVSAYSSLFIVGAMLAYVVILIVAQPSTENTTLSLVNALVSVLIWASVIVICGVVSAMPLALVCANVYLHFVRPDLLKRGFVVSLDVIEALAKQRRHAVAQGATAGS
jgi:hypothetical protein